MTLSRLGRASLYLGYLAITVFAGTEIVLRVFGLAPTDGIFTVSQAEYERVPGIFSPSRSIVDARNVNLEHRVTIDSLGYRGEDFPRRPAADELRIVVAGDSFVWGDFVNDDETLPSQLRRVLAGSCPNPVVINAGIPSVSILAEEAMIVRSLALEPQLAVLVFFENDLDDLVYIRMWEQLAENRKAKSRFPMSVAYPMLRRTALWHTALDVRRRALIRGQLEAQGAAKVDEKATGTAKFENQPVAQSQANVDARPAAARRDGARAEYVQHLTALRNRLNAAGVPLIFVAYPGAETLRSGGEGWVGKWALETAESLGLPTLDLTAGLRASGGEPTARYLLPHDGHPSALGHRLAAEALGAFILSLPPAATACS
jgi:hypothetical protein